MDAERCKEWTKKHGHDTYGSDDSEGDEGELKPKGRKKRKQGKVCTDGKCKACGSTSHQRSNHKDCPFNKKNLKGGVSEDDKGSENSDVIDYSEDGMSDAASEDRLSSSECPSDWCFEDDIICDNICTCGAESRAHKKSCPLSSRNRYVGCNLFPARPSDDSPADRVEKSKLHLVGTQLGKRQKSVSSKPPPVRKRKLNLKVGDYVCLHESKLDNHHIPCRVVQMFGEKCVLYCRKGVLRSGYATSKLLALSSDWSVSVENWRSAKKVSLKEVASDPASLEQCNCDLGKPAKVDVAVFDLTEKSSVVSSHSVSTVSSVWVSTPLYTLMVEKKKEILSPAGWLSDTVITAAQQLILQQFPLMAGLQDPAVHQSLSFEVLRGEFVQIIIVGGCHWCTISNVGCDDGVVNVYDSMYPSVSSSTLKLIASLMFSPAKQLVVRMMDVARQQNGSDCGVLAVSFAYDICSGKDPCSVKYDYKSIRQHLVDCLEKCCISRFPIVGERRSTGVNNTQSVDLHCSCRLPEEIGDKMAECDMCKTWYHQHCLDIPDDIFDDEAEVPWTCKLCASV